MQILGGVVRYEDGIKTVQGDQFSPTRKVAVELNFTLDATDANGSTDPAIQQVLDKAEAFVNAKLGIKVKTLTRAGEVAVTVDNSPPVERRQGYNPDTHEVVNGEIVPKNVPSKAPRAPRKPKETDELTTGDTNKTKADLAKEAGVDATINGKNEDALELSAPKATKPETPLNDDISDLMGGAEVVKPITDADLNDLAQKTMQKINQPENPGGPRIRELVKKYLPEGAQPVMAKIPQERRAEFKTELEALK